MNRSLVGAPRREVYFMGLIDVLTQYDTKKKAAHAAKAVKHGVRDQCSAKCKALLLLISDQLCVCVL